MSCASPRCPAAGEQLVGSGRSDLACHRAACKSPIWASSVQKHPVFLVGKKKKKKKKKTGQTKRPSRENAGVDRTDESARSQGKKNVSEGGSRRVVRSAFSVYASRRQPTALPHRRVYVHGKSGARPCPCPSPLVTTTTTTTGAPQPAQLLRAPPLASLSSSILATRFLNSRYWHFS